VAVVAGPKVAEEPTSEVGPEQPHRVVVVVESSCRVDVGIAAAGSVEVEPRLLELAASSFV